MCQLAAHKEDAAGQLAHLHISCLHMGMFARLHISTLILWQL